MGGSAQHSCWEIEARIEAIAGSVAGSRGSVLSGVRAWAWFHQHVLRRRDSPLPPRTDDLLRWSTLFRNEKTFINYCSYVRVACELKGDAIDAFKHPSLRRAKKAIAKRREFIAREPMFIRCELLVVLTTRTQGWHVALVHQVGTATESSSVGAKTARLRGLGDAYISGIHFPFAGRRAACVQHWCEYGCAFASGAVGGPADGQGESPGWHRVSRLQAVRRQSGGMAAKA